MTAPLRQSPFARSHAVIIGVNAYGHGIPALRTAVNDARRLGHLLETEHGYEVALLLDADASLARISALLTHELPSRVGSEDRVLFYWAGHGTALDGDSGPNGYLLPVDARRDDVATFLHMPLVHDALLALPCRHMLVMLDSCFSGAFRWSGTRDGRFEGSVVHREKYDRFVRDAAWQVITSASQDQRALDQLHTGALGSRDGSNGHSPFALALFNALDGAADVMGGQGGDGLITAHELYVYLDEHLQGAAIDAGTRQSPGLWPLRKHDKGQFVFFVPGRDLDLPPAPPLTFESNPWLGLNAYDAADQALFFGRDAQIAALREHVDTHALSVVLGASGTGKSSLVKAGLVPRLQAEGWHVLPVIRPGTSPLVALTRALDPEFDATTQFAVVSPDSVRTRVREMLPVHHGRRIALVIDQWEELITLARSDDVSTEFVAVIAELLAAHGDMLRVVVTLRTDFEPNFDRSLLGEQWRDGRFVIAPMSREDLRDVIEKPAAKRVVFFEPPTMVETLLDEVVATPGALPLLSFALSEMYIAYLTRRGDDRAIVRDDYEALGGVVGALRSRADHEYEQLDAAHRATLARVMLRMVVADGGMLARRRVSDAELEYPDNAENTRRARVVACLTDARLLVRGREPDGEPFVEPAHDALVRGWGRLIRWIHEAGTDAIPLVTRQKLGIAAEDWTRAEQRTRDGLLWQDAARSAMLAPVVKTKAPWLNRRELAFAERSVRGRRVTRTIARAATAAIVLVAAAALWQRGVAQRQAQAAGRLLAQEYLRDATDRRLTPQLQAANALAAARLDVGGEAPLVGLYSVLSEIILPSVRAAHRKGVVAVAFSPDGRRFLTGSRDSTASLWDAITGSPIGEPMRHAGAVVSVAFDPTGALLATASHDGTARLWDGRDGRARGEPLAFEGKVNVVSFSADGLQVLAAADDGTARVWNTRTGLPVGSPLRSGPVGRGAVLTASFDLTGRRVVTAGVDGVARVWSVREGVEVAAPMIHGDSLHSAVFSPDGTRILTASRDGVARLWSARTGKHLDIALRHQGPIVSAVFSSDGTRVLTASDDNTARVWDAMTGQSIGPALRNSRAISSASFSADDSRIVTASKDSSVRVWDARTLTPLSQELKTDLELGLAIFSPDGSRVAAVGPKVFVIRYESQSFSVRRNMFVPSPPDDHAAYVWGPMRTSLGAQLPGRATSISVGANAPLVLTADASETGVALGDAYLWNLSAQPTGTPRFRHGAPLITATLGARDSRVVTTGVDRLVRVWDAGSGVSLGPSLRRDQSVTVPKVSPDGNYVRVFYAWEDTLWSLRSGRAVDHVKGTSTLPARPWLIGLRRIFEEFLADRLREWRSEGVSWYVRIEEIGLRGPNGARILQMQPVVQLWDTWRREPVGAPLRHNNSVTFAAFSPNGARLVTTSLDSTARVWNANTGESVGVKLQHDAPVVSASFSSDGLRILTISNDSTVRIWSARSGAPTGQVFRHSDDVRQAMFIADGALVVTRTAGNVVRLWDARTLNSRDRTRLLDLAEVLIGGQMRGPRDFVSGVPDRNARLDAWKQRAAAWSNAPDGSFEQWVHWYFSDPATRADQPGLWRSAPE